MMISQPCAIPACPGELFLDIETCRSIYQVDGSVIVPDDPLMSAWTVTCTEGHIIWTHIDQIRVDNLNGLTQDDETTDRPPTFRAGAAWWA